MLNVIYDLSFVGNNTDVTRVLNMVRDECATIDTITSPLFVIDDIGKYRPSRRDNLETKKASFMNQHDEDDVERRFASSFFDSVMSWGDGKKDKSAIGFVVFVDVNSELMNIVLVNTTDNERTWTSRHGCLKDQYANDFEDAHVTICDILKFMDNLGIVKNIEDRFEYYGKWDVDHALDKWEEWTKTIFHVAMRGLKKNGDSVVIGGKWHVTRDDSSETGIVVKEIAKR